MRVPESGDIPASVEVVPASAFEECTKLTEILFAADCRLRVLDGFKGCTSLSRVEIPEAVEEVAESAFESCTALTEVILAANSRLTKINGFHGCTSLLRLKIPASIQAINSLPGYRFRVLGPSFQPLRRELIFESGTQIKTMPNRFCAFVTYSDDDDLKKHRRSVNLKTLRVFKNRYA
jgi:hypothetical protein